MDRRRFFFILIGLSVIFGVWTCRLLWLQLPGRLSYAADRDNGVDMAAASVMQREQSVSLDDGRGDIIDRKGRPMTGKTIQTLVAIPLNGQLPLSREQLSRLTSVLHTTPEQWTSFVNGLKQPDFWRRSPRDEPVSLDSGQVRTIRSMGNPRLIVLPYKLRYFPPFGASQLIGFIGEHPERLQQHYSEQLKQGKMTLSSAIGGSGLEKAFDRYLQGIGGISVSFFTDTKGNPLPGLDTRVIRPDNPLYPLKLVTTLDADIQNQIETLMDKQGIKEGAVVVLDVSNANIVAMASRPAMDPSRIDPNGNDWMNRAIKQIAPGSIYKTVVAAAALEEGVATSNEKFDCDGQLGKYGFSCWRPDGHGRLTFEEAFAQSCNITFAKVVSRLSADKLREYADKLGLLRPNGWQGRAGYDGRLLTQLDGEDSGQLYTPETPLPDGGVLVQSAIGQRDVQITPLQAANLIVTLLHGGNMKSPRLVKEIRYRDGHVLEKFEERDLQTDTDPLSGTTSRKLLRWMGEVVQDGTGKALRSAEWKLAGKSGTAQVQANGKPAEHQWFIGYGPVNAPRFAVAVVVENVPENARQQAIPLFRSVMDALADNSTGTNGK